MSASSIPLPGSIVWAQFDVKNWWPAEAVRVHRKRLMVRKLTGKNKMCVVHLFCFAMPDV